MALTLAALTVISMTHAATPAPAFTFHFDAGANETVQTVENKRKPKPRPPTIGGESTHQDHKGEIEVLAGRQKPRRALPDVCKTPSPILVPIPYPNT